jgi:hypothetical protein
MRVESMHVNNRERVRQTFDDNQRGRPEKLPPALAGEMVEDIRERASTVSTINRTAFIGNYLPRQCGIATFTTDLREAMAAEYVDRAFIALPINDNESDYNSPTA